MFFNLSFQVSSSITVWSYPIFHVTIFFGKIIASWRPEIALELDWVWVCATAYPEANEESGPHLCQWTNDLSRRRTTGRVCPCPDRPWFCGQPTRTSQRTSSSELHKSGSAEDNRWRACYQDLIGLHRVVTEGNEAGGGGEKRTESWGDRDFVSPQRKVAWMGLLNNALGQWEKLFFKKNWECKQLCM